MLKEVNNCKRLLKKIYNDKLETVICNDTKTICYICKNVIMEPTMVIDRDQFTRNILGTTRFKCALKNKMSPDYLKIPIIFHNLRGYNSHFLMQNIGDFVKNNKMKDKKGKEYEMSINVIPNNFEKYMAFMVGNHMVFIDSFQFMSSSLDKLVGNLSDDAFKYTREEFENEKFSLMKKKGVYPYDYMDSFKKFKNKKLPTKEEFYSIMNDESISDDDYKHAQKVWETFNLKNMGEYHDLYLKSDVLLLADVFENFRETCLQLYGPRYSIEQKNSTDDSRYIQPLIFETPIFRSEVT